MKLHIKWLPVSQLWVCGPRQPDMSRNWMCCAGQTPHEAFLNATACLKTNDNTWLSRIKQFLLDLK
jgi:hypothetical protein